MPYLIYAAIFLVFFWVAIKIYTHFDKKEKEITEKYKPIDEVIDEFDAVNIASATEDFHSQIIKRKRKIKEQQLKNAEKEKKHGI